MKRTKKIRKEEVHWVLRCTILTVGVLVLLCSPYMILTSNAQGHSGQVVNYQGMAYIAEQEIRAEELRVKTEKEVDVTANVEFTYDEYEYDPSTELDDDDD